MLYIECVSNAPSQLSGDYREVSVVGRLVARFQENRFQSLSTVFLLAAMITGSYPQSFAVPIEGGDPEAKTEHQEALSSVVHLFTVTKEGRSFACTGTVVAKNIVLTAHHCAKNSETGEAFYYPGSFVLLNKKEMTQVVEVVNPNVKNGADMTGEGLSIDLSLLLLKPLACEKSVLDSKPIPIMGVNTDARMPKKILMAGYGMVHPQIEESGELNAGFNEVVEKGHPSTFSILVKRTDQYRWKVDAGKMFSMKSPGVALIPTKNEASILQGDSGGPAMGLDESGNAYVVGVASTVKHQADASPDVYGVVSAEHKVLHSHRAFQASGIPLVDIGRSREALHEFNKALSDLDLVSTMGVVKKDFYIMKISKRSTEGQYTSMNYGANPAFVRQGLMKLEAIRNSQENPCL